MSTIHVLTSTLKDGYAPICNYYNANKPADWMPISKLRAAEGGFEMNLNPSEKAHSLECVKSMGRMSDENDKVRQLRWTGDGFLKSNGHIGFTREQTHLLCRALQHSLGGDKVELV